MFNESVMGNLLVAPVMKHLPFAKTRRDQSLAIAKGT